MTRSAKVARLTRLRAITGLLISALVPFAAQTYLVAFLTTVVAIPSKVSGMPLCSTVTRLMSFFTAIEAASACSTPSRAGLGAVLGLSGSAYEASMESVPTM